MQLPCLSLLPQTFHAVPCLDVHVDAMDVAGENQIDIDHDMTKQRLDPDGLAIGEPFSEIVSGLSGPVRFCWQGVSVRIARAPSSGLPSCHHT